MAWARFSARYEHRWPSRAITVYQPHGGTDGNGLYSVKREVLDAAKAAGKATEARKGGKPLADGPEREAAGSVAGGNPAADANRASGNGLEHADGARRGDDVPADPRAG